MKAKRQVRDHASKIAVGTKTSQCLTGTIRWTSNSYRVLSRMNTLARWRSWQTGNNLLLKKSTKEIYRFYYRANDCD